LGTQKWSTRGRKGGKRGGAVHHVWLDEWACYDGLMSD
jgi:hypothetical protein